MTDQARNSQDMDSPAATSPVPRITEDPDSALARGSRVGATHDVHGGGDPRLVASFEDSIDLCELLGGSRALTVLSLLPGVTTIGSDPRSSVVMPAVHPHQAEVRRDPMDEYRIFDTSPDQSTLVDGRRATGQSLHSGDRISLGRWTFVYARAEFADHGSPFGGHSGGLPHGYRRWQPTPYPRGTSLSGGRDPSGDDPGEYY